MHMWVRRLLHGNPNVIATARRFAGKTLYSKEELQDIKKWLANYSGGNVCIKKMNDSIVCVEWEHKRRHNAFTGSMISQLDDVLQEVEANCPKGVIFRGAGGSFCSGGDLNFVKQISNSEDGVKMSKFMQNLTTRITCLPAVSVALIEGPALGGGAELALCADFRVATPTARIGFKQARMGVTPAWGGGARLVSIIGREAAMQLLLSGEDVLPEEALQLRLYNYVIPGERLQSAGGRHTVDDPLMEAVKWLDRLVGKVPINVVHTTKRLIEKPSFVRLKDALTDELSLFQTVWGDRDHLSALQAARPTRSQENNSN